MSAIAARLAELAQLGRHAGGIDRALATPPERDARERFARWARDAGYALTQDAAGNTFARRPGRRADALPILVGSHLDTVATGGAYDGAYGVAGALCALELLDHRNVLLDHPVEAVAWAGEEGSRFPLGCLGSSVFAGIVPLHEALALRDDAGTSYADALARADSGLLQGVALREPASAAAYLELHVEQGPVLEAHGARLGVVTAIAGQRRYRAEITGESGHAGTVPMQGRADALSAAAEIILALEAAARRTGTAVVTVGRVQVEPGGTNVIPARVVFSIDARAPDESAIDAVEAAYEEAAAAAARSRGVRPVLETLERRAPALMDERLRAALWRAVRPLDPLARDMMSGAGHDAMCLARVAPAAMLFVPSIGGRSHVGDERTADADLELGVTALAGALIEVDALLAAK